mmetsp:Transcript_70507/g.131880  ORF Transcript_70507/g.131880 Transcript_70507/m.131880 type:complete len:281 (-) Transcript_70507:17-859(-)
MGGDGGQVIDRATMVRTKGYGLTKGTGGRYANSLGEMANYVQMTFEDRGLGPLEKRRTRMTSCFLSQEALKDPVVACRLGNLYNKEALINAMLNRNMPSDLAHLRALKDVKECKLQWTEASGGGARSMVCPMTREDLDSGGTRAVLIWPTGAVLSAKYLAEMKPKECPVTGKPFNREEDVIPLAPDAEELEKLREKLQVKKRKVSDKASTAAAGEDALCKVEEAEESAEKAGDDAAAAKKKSKREPSAVFQSLFSKGKSEGLTGTRDAFGTPAYNRGAHL